LPGGTFANVNVPVESLTWVWRTVPTESFSWNVNPCSPFVSVGCLIPSAFSSLYLWPTSVPQFEMFAVLGAMKSLSSAVKDADDRLFR
jgi:hypothetical protein